MATEQALPLTQAAQKLKLGYNAVLRLVLIGELHGWQERGRWFVAAKSLERFAMQNGADHD